MRYGARFMASITNVDAQNKVVSIKLEPTGDSASKKKSKKQESNKTTLNWDSIQKDLNATFFILCLREILIGHKDQMPSINSHSLVTLSQVSEQVIQNYRDDATEIPQVDKVISSVKLVNEAQVQNDAIKNCQLVKALEVPNVINQEITECIQQDQYRIFEVQFKASSMIRHLNKLINAPQLVQISAFSDFDEINDLSE